jgi:arylsulfatase A-like enzyme
MATFMNRSLLLPIAGFLAFACACCKKSPVERVLLVSLDTTRADYVDSGRGGRAWTPELRRFAAGSWVFDNAYSPIPQTLPAHLAVLSGRLPHELGVFGNEYVYDGR